MTPEDEFVTHGELARVLDLHRRAYETLLWLDNTALAHPHLLNERTADELRDPRACIAWLKRHHAQVPSRLRPNSLEAEPFAWLFSSFFQTSFRIERRFHDGRPYYRIIANKDAAAGRSKLAARKVPRRLKRKRQNEAERLKLLALSDIGVPRDAAGFQDAADAATDFCDAEDSIVWAYAWELVRRSRGYSHGAAPHVLWKEMSKATREALTADRVWRARECLAAALGSKLHVGLASQTDPSTLPGLQRNPS